MDLCFCSIDQRASIPEMMMYLISILCLIIINLAHLLPETSMAFQYTTVDVQLFSSFAEKCFTIRLAVLPIVTYVMYITHPLSILLYTNCPRSKYGYRGFDLGVVSHRCGLLQLTAKGICVENYEVDNVFADGDLSSGLKTHTN